MRQMFGIDIWPIIAVVGGALIAFGAALRKAYNAGRDKERVEKAKRDDQIEFEFEKIDATAPNLDNSIKRLRERSDRDGS